MRSIQNVRGGSGCRGCALLLATLSLWGCVSQAAAGKVMTVSGVVLTGVGVLDYAGALGANCRSQAVGVTETQSSCGSSGHPDRGGAVVLMGAGVIVGVTGLLVWLLADPADESKPSTVRATQPPLPSSQPSAAESGDPTALRLQPGAPGSTQSAADGGIDLLPRSLE